MTNLPKVDLVGVGLNATDTLIPVPHYPERGSKVEVDSANVLLGGQVATAIAACQQWGLRTRYVGKVGDDHAAALHRAEFSDSAWKRTFSPRPHPPVGSPSSWLIPSANAPCFGSATQGWLFCRKNSTASGL